VVYESLGYAVMPMSAKTGKGFRRFPSCCAGEYTLSSADRGRESSLLNRIAPKLDLEVRDVARKTGGGRHTTTYSQLFAIEGGFVADTPGMQTFGFPGDDEESLSRASSSLRLSTRSAASIRDPLARAGVCRQEGG